MSEDFKLGTVYRAKPTYLLQPHFKNRQVLTLVINHGDKNGLGFHNPEGRYIHLHEDALVFYDKVSEPVKEEWYYKVNDQIYVKVQDSTESIRLSRYIKD